ncbi:aldehyde dehydrogenase family protein [Granulosicoccus antarcticus]|uniref:Aldehyde dehydrogenase n=1 Tax=Granulosicoccus antarcticus IMCC3135 TaxID=1192854 RepID=A0A2Z2NPS7_9GAMM|nr:aldehyde dehydrogenase family protein [Granulosicoccus antarcticus]ASJ73279.1 Aldehyde dehydrogenase [Granulosicoccus antarcticus IMCC3135]
MTEPASSIPEPIAAAFAHQRAGIVARRQDFGLAERRDALVRLAAAIKENEQALVTALAKDFGKPEAEVILTELMPVLQEIRHTLRHLRRWMRPQRIAPTVAVLGTSARIRSEARGVCLIIAPWNYPFSLALGPLVSALAAGNSVIIKPSEMTPATSALLTRLIEQTFSPTLVTAIEGGVETSQALLALPFDHIFFTGSPAVGKIVMAAAAKHLTSVTLELGGKSPTIVGPDADLNRAAAWIAFGKFANAGQTCIAPDHIFVHHSVKQAFLSALRDKIANAYGDGHNSAHLAGIVNEQHARRLSRLLGDAVTKGAKVILGGEAEGNRMAPTLIEAITPEMDIDKEEIFGPILPIMVYSDIEEVINRINARPKPLALYVFDKRRAELDRIVAATSSGSVGVNLTVIQYSHTGLPFGGVNSSGIGASHGHHGFRAFSHERAILVNRFSALPLIFPPYTDRIKSLIGFIKRALG